MKAEYINPFIESIFIVFTTMLNVEPKKEEIYLKENALTSYDISGVIGIAGGLTGSVVISFNEKLALKLVSNFLGEEKQGIDSDVVDAVGEIINVIVGNAKRIFSDQLGIRYKISVPSVIVGKGHSINRPSDLKFIGVKYSIKGSEFVIEVALKEDADNND